MNICVFCGRITKEPELKEIGNDNCLVDFTLAVDAYNKKEKQTCFLRHVVFGDSARNFAKYVKKGMKLVVSSAIKPENYTNKDGVEVRTFSWVVNNWEMAEPRKTNQENGSQTQPQSQAQPTSAATSQPPKSVVEDFVSIPDGIPEELPFN